MNKTNKSLLLKSIFVIFAILLITNTVFADSIFESGFNIVKKAGTFVINNAKNAGGFIVNNVKNAGEFLYNNAKNDVTLVKNVVTDPYNTVEHFGEYGKNIVKNYSNLVVNSGKNVFNYAKNSGKNVVDLFSDSSKSKIKFSDLELPAASSIVIKQDGSCTDPNYPYHLSIQGGAQGISNTILYFGFAGPITFNNNKTDILNFIYNKQYKSTSGKIVSDISDNIIKIDADKFTWARNGTDSQVNFQNALFCLSKSFSGKKVNIFTWQYKDGENANLGPNDESYSLEEFKANYNSAVNYEFDVIENISVSALTDENTSGDESTGSGSGNVGSGSTDAAATKCPSDYIYSAYDPIWFAFMDKVKNITDNKVVFKCIDNISYNVCNKDTGAIETITYEELKKDTLKYEIVSTIYKYTLVPLLGQISLQKAIALDTNINNEIIERFKKDICANSDNTNTTIQNGTIKLDFTVFSTVPDISYSTTTATQYKARKINDPEAYLIDYRNNTKNISINLSSFNYTKPLYAIIATPDHSDKIYGYLANVKSTGDFKDYTLQTNFTINSNTLTTSPAALKYTLGPDKMFKFSIAPNINDKFVLIFMQLSDGGSLINLAYTNLYNLDYNAQSIYQLCEINRNIINFYCKGYDCKVPGSCIDRWDFDPSKLENIQGIPVDAIPGAPTTPVTPTPPVTTTTPPVTTAPTLTFTGTCSITKQETLEKYIECLKRNIETVNLSRKYHFIADGKIIRSGGPFLGNFLIDEKYNTNTKCYEEVFNNVVFKIAKQEGLSEEETAQFWSRIAGESGCDVKVGCGEVCGSTGIAQIHITGWNDIGSYNLIKSELQQLKNWSSKYSTFSKYQSSLLGIANDPETALEISIAINRYNTSLIINKSKNAARPFLADMYQTYDQDDSIDMEFATSYVYAGSTYADHLKDGVKIGATRWEGVVAPALNKMGYYLTYKRMIYLCHNDASTSNAFITAYKNIYGGKYCK